MGTFQVVMLETTSKAIEGLQVFYRRVFSKLGYDSARGYEVAFHVLQDKQQAKQSNFLVFDNEVVDVFICDLTLGRDDIVDGLTLIQKLKQRFPRLLVIANSRNNVSEKQVANRVPNFDIFVQKQQISDPRYADYIATRLSNALRRNPCVALDLDRSELAEQFQISKHRVALESMVRELTFVSHHPDPSTAVALARLERLDEGRSKSFVYKMHTRTGNGLNGARTVLKISAAATAQREIDCYMQYVKWYLPYKWRPEMLGNAFWGAWGAVCYVLVDDDNFPYSSLAKAIRQGNLAPFDRAVNGIFGPTNQQWYSRANVRHDGENLIALYHGKWLSKGQEQIDDRIRRLLSDRQLLRNDRVSICGHSLPTPDVYALGVPRSGFSTCLCHRDLNLTNVLYSDHGDFVFLDFQDVGRGHVFEDFIVFENAFRTEYDHGLEMQQAFEEELRLATLPYGDVEFEELTPDLTPFGQRIARIRKLAVANFPDEPFENYLAGLAISAYGMFKFEWLSDRQSLQHLACLMSLGAALESVSEHKTNGGDRQGRSTSSESSVKSAQTK